MKLDKPGVFGPERGMAIVLTLLVSAAISVVALSLILITETDTKIAMATKLNKENLNTADGALQYAIDVIRQKPTTGYLDYPWESVLPPTSYVRMVTGGDGILNNSTYQSGALSSPFYSAADDAGGMTYLTDMSGAAIRDIPVYSDSLQNAYYTVWVEAVQGTTDWNAAGPAGYNQYDFDRYRLLIRARAVGLYGSIKDVVEIIKVVDPDGSPLGDEPGSTQGSVSGLDLGLPVVTF